LGGDWSFAEPDGTQLREDALLLEYGLLRGDTRGAPVYFGRDKNVRFVESHQNQQVKAAPVGVSYPILPRRSELFGEISPIFDSAPGSSLVWGGGLGIGFFIGH
jgi:hypothetical protein